MKAAAELKARGYGIVSGYEDIWPAVNGRAGTPWIVDGKLHINPVREDFPDLAKALHDNGYTNGTTFWTDEWYADMKDAGQRKTF